MEPEQIIMEGEGYSVVLCGKCIIARGPLPLNVFAKIYRRARKGSEMDFNAARMAEATLVIGKPNDLDALRTALAPKVRAAIEADPAAAGLSAGAREWLVTGNQGLSSAALFLRTTGYRPRCLKPHEDASHPLDPDDLNRCLHLCEAAPEVAERIRAMRGLSPQWDVLVEHWDELRTLLSDEVGPDPKRGASAPNTHQRMQALGL